MILRSLGSLAIALAGYALLRFGSYLLRLYERNFRRDAPTTMSMDVFSVIAAGPWTPIVVLAAGLICIGGIGIVFGIAQFLARLFRFGIYA
jgi:hypothetical protein